jgi:hypothetical protein
MAARALQALPAGSLPAANGGAAYPSGSGSRMIVTRRFRARPWAVALSETGREAAIPEAEMRFSGIFASRTKNWTMFAARIADNCQFEEKGPVRMG